MKSQSAQILFSFLLGKRNTEIILTVFFILIFSSSCWVNNKTNPSSNKLNHTDSQVVQKTLSTKKIQDSSNIIGYWFVPHSARVNIYFYDDGKFEFNDYNLALDKYEHLVGSYRLVDSVLTLFYNDRPKQSFKFYKDVDENYYIKKRGYYFAKGDSL